MVMEDAEVAARIYIIRNFRPVLPHWIWWEWLRDKTVEYHSYVRGEWDRDGRFWPDKGVERRACCDRIQLPSLRRRWRLWEHCRTIRHCAALVGADEGNVRARVRELRRALELAGEIIRR
jgi:hypothetical protein